MTISQYGGWLAVVGMIGIFMLGGILTSMGTNPKDPRSPGWKLGCVLGTLLIAVLVFGLAVAGVGLVLR